MGEVASVVEAFSCEACAKYVCNAMHCHSTCLGCCEFDFETTEINVVPDDASEYSIELEGGCCEGHYKKDV